MSGSRRSALRSIRFKLALVSLTLLTIPWAGYRFIQDTEHFLRQAQERTLLGTAQTVAAILHNRSGMFTPGATSLASEPAQQLVYVLPLQRSVQLDGYDEEWLPYRESRQPVPRQGEPVFDYLLGEHGGYLYLLIEIRDDRIVYERPQAVRSDRCDHLELQLEAPQGNNIRYRIATSAPGWVNARVVDQDAPGGPPLRTESRIQGEWQESDRGYTLELRIPRYLVGEAIAFGVVDMDQPDQPESRHSQFAGPFPGEPGRLVRPNPEIEGLIGSVDHESVRIWVLNTRRQVLARRGRLMAPDEEPMPSEDPDSPGLLKAIFRLVLAQPADRFQDEFSGRTRLDGPEITSALQGQPETRRRVTPDEKAMILSAAWPIRSGERVVGSVLVEQTTNQILSLQNQAMERLLGITLLLFLLSGVALFGFATLLTGRIKRLHNRVEAAVSPDGRILGSMRPTGGRDEIGDLGRSFSSVLNRLSEYNRYLESMASRLAHELRTPLALVKSSLENLESTSQGDGYSPYIQRAREGTERIGLILHRMREATRLEQLLQQSRFEPFDLADLTGIAGESYGDVFPGVGFEVEVPEQPVMLNGTADLISQALDKLVGNAVDFHASGSTITLRLTRDDNRARLSVINLGPALPEGMAGELFESMVSIRQERGNEPHLGLGLYLVRLICEFHSGQAEARNLEAGTGVCFSMILPLER